MTWHDMTLQVLKVRLSLKKAYVGAGLKHVLAAKQGFTKALQAILPKLEAEKEKVTKNVITRQSRLVPSLVFQVCMYMYLIPPLTIKLDAK